MAGKQEPAPIILDFLLQYGEEGEIEGGPTDMEDENQFIQYKEFKHKAMAFLLESYKRELATIHPDVGLEYDDNFRNLRRANETIKAFQMSKFVAPSMPGHCRPSWDLLDDPPLSEDGTYDMKKMRRAPFVTFTVTVGECDFELKLPESSGDQLINKVKEGLDQCCARLASANKLRATPNCVLSPFISRAALEYAIHHDDDGAKSAKYWALPALPEIINMFLARETIFV